jgi:hypothetical protein
MNLSDLLNIISECCDDDLSKLKTKLLRYNTDSSIDIERLVLKLSENLPSRKQLCQLIENSCRNGSSLELETHILYGHKYQLDIDLNYDDSCLPVIAARNNNLMCLKILQKYGANMKNDNILSIAALYGHVDIVLYLLNNGANPRNLVSTASYTNYPNIKNIFDEYISELSP